MYTSQNWFKRISAIGFIFSSDSGINMRLIYRSCVLGSLLACLFSAPVAGAQQRIPVGLNHFFVVLGSESYQAIEASEFVTAEFSPFEYRATVRNDRSYAGLYFYGENTYFEIFDEKTRGPDSRGFSMLALGVDNVGGGERGHPYLKKENEDTHIFKH
jgi:hypothetical protein